MTTSDHHALHECPRCGLRGAMAMVPSPAREGDMLPRVEPGIRFECGTTMRQQSHLCTLIEQRIADVRREA